MAANRSYRSKVWLGQRKGRLCWIARIYWADKAETGEPFDTEDQARAWVKARIDDHIAKGGW